MAWTQHLRAVFTAPGRRRQIRDQTEDLEREEFLAALRAAGPRRPSTAKRGPTDR